MGHRIKLVACRGRLTGQEFVLDGPGSCILGRASDCTIHVPTEPEYEDVSRHHCLFRVVPPAVQVRDLGSRNGTFVNGMPIGRRPAHLPPEAADLAAGPACDLADGDEVRAGSLVLRVHIEGSRTHAVPATLGRAESASLPCALH